MAFDKMVVNYKGVEITIEGIEFAQLFLDKLNSFGGDCSDKCKEMRAKLSDAIDDHWQEREDYGPNGDATTPGFFKPA